MMSRSAKAAQSGQKVFSFDSPGSNHSRKRKGPDHDDLEQELARPSKSDYNQVRKALILTRSEVGRKVAEIQEKDRELEESNRVLREKEHQLLLCSKIHNQIRDAQEQGSVPIKIVNGGRNGDGSHETLPGEKETVECNLTRPPRNMATSLGIAIHEFANQYFGGKLQQPSNAQLGAGWAHQYMQATTPGEETYMDYLRSRRRCAMIIEAFIWRFICGAIFNDALWSGSEEMRRHVSGLQNLLAKFHNSPNSEPKRLKNYQQWKRQTTKLVLEIREAGTTDDADFHLFNLERHFANAASEVITPFMRASLVGHKDALIKIIHQAIELDKVISKQQPCYTWSFSPQLIESPFNFSLDQEKIMKVHSGENTASKLGRTTKAKVHLVVAPGLSQRGVDNSPSASFIEERWVIPMTVSCVKPRQQHKFRSGHDGSDSTVDW